MSSKKLFYFLAISLICGLIAGGVAHANINAIGGFVTNADGTPVAGATVVFPGFGLVGSSGVTTGADGAYSMPYIDLNNKLINAGDQIEATVTTTDGDTVTKTYTFTAADVSAGGEATFNITFVSTTVTVAVSPASFMADTTGTGAVTVTVELEGPVTDENVTLSLSPNVGTVTSPATNNGDGTYSATYTSGTAAGNVTITATATKSGASGMATVVINAGPPADITLTASSNTVSSLGSATITVTVTDSNGNGVGGASLTGTASGSGSVGAFAADAAKFGSYTATYTAPMVEAEGSETVTVSTDGVSADLTLKLTPEPPIEVNLLVIEGIVYKVDGGVPADGVTATVTVGSNAPETRTTDADGSFEVTLINPLAPVARTGDLVSVVVTDATGAERGSTQLPLTNDRLDGTAVMVSVTTDIVVPPRSVNALVVEGTVHKEDGATGAGSGLNVMVTVGSTTQTVQTEGDGSYSTAFVGALSPVAVTGDPVSIVASDGSGERGRAEFALSNVQLGTTGSAQVTQNITTDIGLTSNVLALLGTVYLKNGDSPIAASNDLREGELTVTATNTTRNLSVDGVVDDDGQYDIAFIGATAAVVETDDVITVEVSNDAGEAVGSVSHTITIADLETPLLTLDVKTSEPAQIRVLNIAGSVVEIDGRPAAGVPVTITIEHADGTSSAPAVVTTDAMGGYEHLFLDLVNPIAATGDTLIIDVLRVADQFIGYKTVALRSHLLADAQTQQMIIDPITMVPPKLELGGLSINTHYTGIQDPMIQDLLNADLVGLAAAAAALAGDDGSGNPLVALPPSLPILISPLLATIGAFQLELPEGFDVGDENIAMESFGNAITTHPTAWAAFPAAERTPGRWINGNQLNLYISGAPTIEGVTFTLNGDTVEGKSVPAGGSFRYTFQLEEEWVALFSGSMPAFGSVQLMIDGHPDSPIDMAPGAAGGVWSADVMLNPGAKVSYYYMIDLAEPYVDQMASIAIRRFPFIDPLNRQVKTEGLSQAIEGLLESEVTALDPGVRSVFSVPAVDHQQSLWVGKFYLSADGEHQLDVNVSYRGGHQEAITGKTLHVDRTAPSTDVTLDLDDPGHNAGMYMREDGTYVATGLMPGEASLTVSPTTRLSEAAAYMFQLARLDGAGHPGAWNPVVTADLLPLTLEKLLTDAGSVLPLSFGTPIDMLIRNSEGGGLLGRYGIRAVGIDSLLNMDSGAPMSVTVELVPPDPDIAEVTYVTADFDGNGKFEGLEMQPASGDVVIFSDSKVTLTVDMIERTAHPLTSIVLEYQLPGSDWITIGGFRAADLIGTDMGDQMPVTLPVPDIPGMPDRGAQVMLRTVTTNKLNVVNEHVVVANYERRLAPSVSGIYANVTDRNPDSGGAQGFITVSAFTQAMTNPGTDAVQLEIRRSADTEWKPLGIVQIANSKVVSQVNLAIIDGLVNAIVAGAPTAPISPLYREWPLTIDSARLIIDNARLEDTILDNTPAASDASLDDNPYVLRAIAVDAAAGRYESAEGRGFSLDNYSPTAIITVENEDEEVAPDADGSYYVSGLLHESVPGPVLTLTARTGAHPNAFKGGMMLAVNNATGEAMEIPATGFTPAGNHTYTGAFDLGSVPNGMYTFMAVAHASDGSVEERIDAMTMAITVEVGNFTPPENFANPTVDILSLINTRDEARSPSEIDAEYTAGFPAIDEKVTATLMVPNVSEGDLDVRIGDDQMSAASMGALMVTQMEGSNDNVIMVDTSGLEEGIYGLVGVVIKPNGEIQFHLPSIQVDRTGPTIAIVSPVERHQVTTLPTVHVTFSDTTGFDVTDTDPRHAVLTLTRLADEVEIEITETLIRLTAAEDGEVLTRSGDIAYTHDDPVVGGAYRVGATVMDVLGNQTVAESVEFTVEGVRPTVSIVSPIAGRIIDPRQPLIISIALTGNGDITVSEFQINGNDLEGTLENNWLTYTMQPPLVGEADSIIQRGSDNTISVKIVDSEGRTAEGSASFAVSLDSTPPVISGPSPKGDITRKIGRITALVTDNESDITRIQYALDDSPLTDISFSPARVYEVGGGKEVKGQTSFNLFDAPLGTHTVTIVAESTGGTTTLNWEFTIVHPDQKPPEVVTYSPLGIIRTDRPVLAATVSDESGFARDGITLILAGVPGNQGSGRRSSPTSTTVTFTPSIAVTPGPYTARLTVIDKYNNRTEAEWQFTVELDETPPSITTTAPHGVIHLDKPIITVSASDDRSGVDSIAITAKDGRGLPVNGVTDVRSDKTAATFTPTQSLRDGVYTVDVKVADQAGNEASSRWQFTVELDLVPPSVLITRPAQEHTENRRPIISATYTDNMSGVDADSIKLTLDGTTVEPDDVSETQVVFTPGYDLPFGEHTVTLELSDTAPKANTAVHEWTFYVERIGIADARNYPNPFEDETTIAFRISRQARITVRVYDFTGRLVATPVANSIREAGVVEIHWHGDTSAGDHLARGVYFCHILMESELEPQSAILKMAIVAD